ncbi:hypothetical protein AC1031_020112 [Aphanomyces cochlioides]|nr:hypothetical protein AC1031_020112 [Aphanomyces cochlioides]
MEDALRVVDEFGGKSTDGFFGLYDGHGGREISTYLKENLHASVLNELSQDGAAADVPTCIQRAFVLTDADCCELQEAKNAGSTAAIAFIRQEGDVRALYAANVGDSRIVLCRNGKAERLTEDHKPDVPSEAMRICDAGGFIMHNRTSGVLAISRYSMALYQNETRWRRSFGDRELKKWVIAQPYQSRSMCTTVERPHVDKSFVDWTRHAHFSFSLAMACGTKWTTKTPWISSWHCQHPIEPTQLKRL